MIDAISIFQVYTLTITDIVIIKVIVGQHHNQVVTHMVLERLVHETKVLMEAVYNNMMFQLHIKV